MSGDMPRFRAALAKRVMAPADMIPAFAQSAIVPLESNRAVLSEES